MKRSNICKIVCVIFCICILFGCSNQESEKQDILKEQEKTPERSQEENIQKTQEKAKSKQKISVADWSAYFKGLNGAAVIYEPSKERYTMYNKKLAKKRRSPCSTFKIISSLVGLENGVIDPDDSVRKWSGEIFWNEEWNHDIDFREAFRTSCVWYYRKIIDEIGKDTMQSALNKLEYGNCDISDWKGKRNNNNNNRALTGFWIESSLKISPKEQTEVLERIFGKNTKYSEDIQNYLKQVMLVSDQNESDIIVYGKTGTGKSHGVTVDAWFTGFAEKSKEKIYFCVYLGKSKGRNVDSTIAKEIAVQIISNYCKKL